MNSERPPRPDSSLESIQKYEALNVELNALLKHKANLGEGKGRINEILAEQEQLQKKIESFWSHINKTE